MSSPLAFSSLMKYNVDSFSIWIHRIHRIIRAICIRTDVVVLLTQRVDGGEAGKDGVVPAGTVVILVQTMKMNIGGDGSSQAKRPRSSAPDHINDMTNARSTLFIVPSFHSN